MAHPALDTAGIYTGSGLKAYLDRQRAHALVGSDAYRTVAWELRRAIERMGSGAFGGPKAKLNARRMVRPLMHAASVGEDQARMFSLVWEIHNGIFVPEAQANQANTYRPTS
jgi:hypothetical protein